MIKEEEEEAFTQPHMPDGDAMVGSSQPVSEVGVVGAEESSSRAQDYVKDPRKIARKYAIVLFCCFSYVGLFLRLVFAWLARKFEENLSKV